MAWQVPAGRGGGCPTETPPRSFSFPSPPPMGRGRRGGEEEERARERDAASSLLSVALPVMVTRSAGLSST